MNKLVKFIIGISLISGNSQAATVTISTGLGGASVQGVTLETSLDHTQLVDSANYYVAVGRYVGGTFTPWAGTSAVADNATGSPSREVSGSFSTVTGGAFNGLQIHVYVGLLASVATSPAAAFTPSGPAWAVFTRNDTNLFPTSNTIDLQTVSFAAPSVLTILARGNALNAFNGSTNTPSGSATNYFYLVPEPSTALMVAVGVLGLLRRRRI